MRLHSLNRKRRDRRPRGAALLESVVAVAIAAFVLVGVAQLLVLISGQRRTLEQRMLAAREAGNLMEDLMSRPWSEITPENAAAVELPESCRQYLPDAQLRVEVVSEGQTEDVRRIDVRIEWRDWPNRRGEPVRLTAWKCRWEEKAP